MLVLSMVYELSETVKMEVTEAFVANFDSYYLTASQPAHHVTFADLTLINYSMMHGDLNAHLREWCVAYY
jgi:hypothetical protein